MGTLFYCHYENTHLYYYGHTYYSLPSFSNFFKTNVTDNDVDVTDNDVDVIGYLQFIKHASENKLTIISLYVSPIFQGKGYGSSLLKNVIKFAKKQEYLITLDDMSDRFRSDHNIYIKNGFKYTDSSGPEMQLNS